MNPDESLAKIEKAYDSPPLWYDIRGFFVLTFAYRSTLWAQIALFGNNIGPRHLEGADWVWHLVRHHPCVEANDGPPS